MTPEDSSTFNPRVLTIGSTDPEATGDEFTYNYVYSYNDKVFDIFLIHQTLPGYDSVDPLERQLLHTLEKFVSCDGDDYEDIMRMLEEGAKVDKEIGQDVLEACRPLMQNLAPMIKQQPDIKPLVSYMYPEIITLQLVTIEGKLSAVRRDNLPKLDFHQPASNTQTFDDMGLPIYPVSDIQVLADLYRGVLKVSVSVGDDVQVLCAKLTRKTRHDSFNQEVQKLHVVTKAGFESSIKVPHLRGFIKSHTGIVGFLMDYIPSRGHDLGSLLRGQTDSTGSVYVVTKAQKQKWTAQIEHTLKALHSRNVLWGDVKTSNVLIDDLTEDAWIVDFGGGNTYGWIDPALHGTVGGDLQALEKIKAVLLEA